jgi:hypothetical protein
MSSVLAKCPTYPIYLLCNFQHEAWMLFSFQCFQTWVEFVLPEWHLCNPQQTCFHFDSPNDRKRKLGKLMYYSFKVHRNGWQLIVTAQTQLHAVLDSSNIDIEVKVEVNLRPTVSRSASLGVRHPSKIRDQFFFLLEISLRQLRGCYFVAPSLTRRRVCNLLYNCFWALPEQSLLGRSPAELRPYFTVSSETPPTWRARFPYLYPPGIGRPSYTPGALGSLFVASYDSQVCQF